MNTATPKPHASNDSSRCLYRYPNDRRCQLPGLNSQFGLCQRHFTLSAAVGATSQQSQSDSVDLSADLLGQLSEFKCAPDINQFLARLLILVTQGRITPRRASVLAYITNQLLHSHRAIDREIQLEEDGPVTVEIGDLPRPRRDIPSPAEQRT